jgi:hypothetical protein
MPTEEWRLVPTDLYVRRRADFEKKRPLQLRAVERNLVRYQAMLLEQAIARLISAHFIHPEGRGVASLSEKGFKPKQPPTRLYLYPAQDSKTVYLITIGDKRTQRTDIQDCYDFIETL